MDALYSLIPKSCRLFGQDHAANQGVQSAIGFSLNRSRSNGETRLIGIESQSRGPWPSAKASRQENRDEKNENRHRPDRH
jgi:hypothetical protein